MRSLTLCVIVLFSLFPSCFLAASWKDAATYTTVTSINQSAGTFAPYIFIEGTIDQAPLRIAIDLTLSKSLISLDFIYRTGGIKTSKTYTLTFAADDSRTLRTTLIKNPALVAESKLIQMYGEGVSAALTFSSLSPYALIFDNSHDQQWSLVKNFSLECCTGKEFEEQAREAAMATILVRDDPCKVFTSVLPIHTSSQGPFIILNTLLSTIPIPVKVYASTSPQKKDPELLISNPLLNDLLSNPLSRASFTLPHLKGAVFKGSYFFPSTIKSYIRAMDEHPSKYGLDDFIPLHQAVMDKETFDLYKLPIPKWLAPPLQKDLMTAIKQSVPLSKQYGSLHDPGTLLLPVMMLPSIGAGHFPASMHISHLWHRKIVIYDLKNRMLYLGDRSE